MDDFNYRLMSGLTDIERLLFQAELHRQKKKSKTTAYVLALLLGGAGIHHFYLGRTSRAWAYLLFCWTSIPLLLSIIDLFLIPGYVDDYNNRTAMGIAAKLHFLGASPAPSLGDEA